MNCAKVMQVSDEQIRSMKQIFNKTDIDIAEDILTIREWLKKQPHLPKSIDDERLKKMLLLNKYSVEKVKSKLDMYYTSRTIVPEYFEYRYPLHPRMQANLDVFTFIPLPKLTDDFCRIHLSVIRDGDLEKFDMDVNFAIFFLTHDLRLKYDYAVQDIYIFDFTNYKLGHIMKITPTKFKKMYVILEKAYSDRIKQIHYINAPSYINILVNTVKQVLSKKLADRLYVHESMDTLYELVPKELLPTNYGGNEKSYDELYDNWRKFCDENNSWFLEELNEKSNEKLRPGKPIANELFGMEGTFKKLQID